MNGLNTRFEAAWDGEYRRGRYGDEPPIAFVAEIIRAAGRAGLDERRVLDVGCGNGRNFIAFVDAGFEVSGVDLSSVALSELRRRVPAAAPRLYHGDLSVLPPRAFDVVVAIQVFQHGTRRQCHENISRAQELSSQAESSRSVSTRSRRISIRTMW